MPEPCLELRPFTRALAPLLVVFSLVVALPSYAFGQADEIGFRIDLVPVADPAVTANGYFIYKLQSSAIVIGSVLLKNPGTEPLTIQLAAVDALTAQKGGSAFATSDVMPTGVATWLKFAEPSVTLPAARQKSVDFTVTVPQSMRPGQYLAGISAYIPNATSAAGENQPGSGMGANVTLQTRYIIGVQVDIEGTWAPSLKIESVALVQQPSGPFIGVYMKNSGDVFHKPSGTIVMTDTAGKRVLEQPIEMGTFIPGTDVVYPVKWSGELASGMYNIHISLDYAEDKNATYDSLLKIGPGNAVQDLQNNSGAAQAPGTIGNGNLHAVSPQAPVPAQVLVQEEHGIWWLWIAIVIGILLLIIIALLALNLAKMWRLRGQKEA